MVVTVMRVNMKSNRDFKDGATVTFDKRDEVTVTMKQHLWKQSW